MKREKVTLDPNRPVTLQLKYGTGKMMDDNGFGASVLYTTIDDRALFVDLETSLRIMQLGVQPGESINVTKLVRKGQPPRIDVCLSPATEKMRAVRDCPEAFEAPSQVVEQLTGTLANIVEGKPPAAPRPALVPTPAALADWNSMLVGNTNALIDVFAACLKHSSENHGNSVRPEDVRALLTTAYINLSQGRKSHAA